MSAGQTSYETMVNRGDTGDINGGDASDIGLSASACKSIDVDYANSGGQGTSFIKGTVSGNPQVDGVTVELYRDTDGAWQCYYDGSAGNDSSNEFMPDGCSNTT
ncbi:pilin [Halovibrio salipaludis]|uniref:pilin n=1 Tax=Halovibrio salipaludis TaxID=2032626 RepID=UPI001E580C76